MKYFYLIFIVTIFSCKKEEKKPANLKNQIEEITLLKNYKTLSKRKINDSIEFITAENKYFTINGKFNIKRNLKTDWWTVKQKDTDKMLKIQYLIFGEELFKNQIVFYDKNQIDTLFSKFYTIKKENESLKFYFHSPSSKSDIFEHAYFKYRLISNKKVILTDSIGFKNKNGNFSTNIDLKKLKVNKFGGYFSEYTTRKISKDSMAMGNNTIYVFEEIN